MRSLRDTGTTRGQGSVLWMPRPLVEMDDGWDFKVLVVDGEWVVRWPRHRLAVEEIEKEVALLPALGPLLPVPVPQFEYVSREPWLVVYGFIEGEPLVDEDPDGVRAFLEALHAIDVELVPAPRPDWLETYGEQAEEFRRVVLPCLAPQWPVPRLGCRRRAPPTGADLPPARPVVRGALRRVHRAARVGAKRPRGSPGTAVTDALFVNSGSVGLSYNRHADPPVVRSLAEWALITVQDGAVTAEFRQMGTQRE